MGTQTLYTQELTL